MLRATSAFLFASAVNGYVVLAPGSSSVSCRRCDAEPLMVSRRSAALAELVDKEKLYSPEEAVAILKKTATAKFVETAELHGNLNLDPKYNDQQIRTTVS